MEICEKEVKETPDGASETPLLSSQDPNQTDLELTDSDQRVKAHRIFLEVVLNDAQVPSSWKTKRRRRRT